MKQWRLGIDLGGTKIEAQLFDDENNACWSKRLPTPRGDYQQTLETIKRLVSGAGEFTDQPFSIGLATPGALSKTTGRMKNCNSICLNDQPLQRDLEANLQRPVRLANDADCMALAEAIDGAASKASSVFGIILGTGVGGGVVVEQRLLSGPNDIAGEWGHNPAVAIAGHHYSRPCYCGRLDCIETHLSGPGLVKTYQLIAADNADSAMTSFDIVARKGQYCDMALEQYYQMMAACIAQIVNMLDPHVIVLAGGMSRLPGVLTELEARLADHVIGDSVKTQLCLSHHGDASGARGAAWLWP
ncbi:Fructokinase [Sinobacterium norvegicum]|uniref:Fructokinase n=1 Tax=Sinobacterium norvegicum TaxID=1641715 RepID=A0ABM9AE99_9GAMM|nr:ROK family protein [Sinobacterium norvegicum]CAH0991358.1 Fructokinase [Sinobacterium norvegicum]